MLNVFRHKSFILKKLLYAFCVIAVSACSGPSQSDLTAVSGFTEPTTSVQAPLANSAITFSPASHDYGTVLVNVGTPTQLFTVLNASTYPLTLSSLVSGNANFLIQTNNCSGTLQPFDNCTFNVQFAPTTSGVLNSLLTLSYTSPSVAGTFSSILSVTGSSTSLIAFAGLTSVTQVSTTSVKLNWTGIAGVSSYQAYDVTSGRTLVASMLPTNACVGTVCSYVVSGLTPNTAYTYQIRATDLGGVQEGNIISQSVTTQTAAIFSTITDISGNENSAITTANLSCSDAYASTNLFSISNQSDAALNCALTATTGAAATVSCTPSFKAVAGVHAPWTGTVTVQCAINGANYNKTFTVNVANTNRNPVIQLTAATAQTVSAQFPINPVTATDIHSNGNTDIDGDTLTFSCTFSGGGFAPGTNCTSLPNSFYTMNAATGVINWTPSLAAAVGGNATSYSISLIGNDGHGGSASSPFSVTVNPGVALIGTGSTTTTTSFSWTKITGASSYTVYRLGPLIPLTTVISASCGAGPCTYTDTGLVASSAYTYRVVAFDSLAAIFSTSLDVPITTSSTGAFSSIPTLAASENVNAQTASMSCTDGVHTNLFSITSQSDSTANCSLTATTGAAAKVSCTPGYHAAGGAHPGWTDNVTVQCAMNGTNYSQTFAVNVSNTNRNPAMVVTSSSAQIISAQLPMTAVTAKDSNTNGATDIDGDTLTFTCAFSGGGFGAGTNCTSLPSSSYSMNSATGVMNWTPSIAAAIGGNATTYAISITGNDGQGGTNAATPFNVTVNPGVALTLAAGTTTTTTTQLSWTKITGAANYVVYRLSPFTPMGTITAAACGAGPCIFNDSGLTPATVYTYRVVALDSGGATFSTSLDTPVTTKTIGTFATISSLAANENSNVQTASISCTDTYSSANLFSITAQSDATATCSLTATTGATAKISCTPTFHAAGGVHSSWTDNVTVQCTINGSILTQTFAVNVANVNRAPAPIIGTVTNPTASAGVNTVSFTAKDSNTGSSTDIDGDALHFTCTFAGGGFSAGTNCSSLPGTYSFGLSTGIFSWLPSIAAAISNASTAYTLTITEDDQRAAGNSTATTTTAITILPSVVITSVTNQTFAAGSPLVVGATLNLAFQNTSQSPSAGNTNMSYTCYYDQVIDGTVANTTACSTISGLTFAQANTNGTFSWAPTIAEPGSYELKVCGTLSTTATSSCMTFVVDVYMTPRFAYTANYTASTISMFSVNETTGTLTSLGAAIPTGTSPFGLAVDPTGRFAYTANYGGPSVSMFSINQTTGALTSIAAPIASGTHPYCITIDPTGRFAYTANNGANTASMYSINSSTGVLTSIGADVATGSAPIAIAIDPAGRFAYVANNVGTISMFSINQSTGALTSIAAAVASGTLTYAVAVHPSARFVYSANYNANTVSMFTVNQTTGALTWISNAATGVNPDTVIVDPTGHFVYVGNFTASTISMYTVDQNTGALTSIGADIASGANPNNITIDRTGRFLYSANYGGATASMFSINPVTGALTSIAAAVTTGSHPFTIATTTGSARYAYTANKNASTISTSSLNAATGTIASLGADVATGTFAVSVAVDPSGRFAYTANQNGNSVSMFAINPTSGALSSIGTNASTGVAPSSVTIDPTGRFVYTANYTGHSISMFSINQITGALTSITSDLVTGLWPTAIAVDRTGRFVYAANYDNYSVSMFSINQTTGALTSLGAAVATGAGTYPTFVTVDPTGRYVYTTNSGTSTVSMFSINMTSGLLTSIAANIAAGSGTWGISIDPAGRFAYTANQGNNTVSMYSINQATGALTSIGADITSGGSYLRSATVDPTGRFFYTTTYNGGAVSNVSLFTINTTSGVPSYVGNVATGTQAWSFFATP